MSAMETPFPRRTMLAGAATLGGAVLLAACGSKGTGSGGAAASASPQAGGTAQLVQSADIAVKSILGQNLPNFTLQRLVWNTLTEYDISTLEPKPSLATEWSWSTDRLALTVALRDDVKFHSGRPFGPQDVIDAIQRQAAPPTGLNPGQLKAAAAAVSGVEATGDHEVTIHLANPVSNFFDLFEAMYILDTESIDDLIAGTAFVGTGPFTFGSRTPNVSLALEKNPDYWKSGRPYLDGVEMRVIAQPDAMLSALRSRQAQLAANLPGTTLESLQGNDDFNVTAMKTQDAGWYVGCNVTVSPLDDKRVRQAIAYSIDREKVLTDSLGGIGTSTSIPWSPTSPAFDEDAAGTYSLDIDRAKSLLAEAGASDAELHLAVNAGQSVTGSIAEGIQFSIEQTGLTVIIDPLQDADFVARLVGGQMPGLWVASHGFGQMSPATLLTGAFPFNAAKNASNFSDPAYTDLSQQVFTAGSEEDAQAAYGEVTDFLLDQQFVVDMVSSSYSYTTTSSFQGYGYTLLDFLNLDDAFLES